MFASADSQAARRRWHAVAVRPLLPAFALLAAACSAPTVPPFTPPPLQAEFGHHAGTPISGPLSEAASGPLDPEPGAALALQARAVVLEQAPAVAVEALASQTSLQLAHPGAEPLLAATRLGAGVGRVPAGEAEAFLAALADGSFGRTAAVGDASAALPAGVTAALRLSSPAPDFPFTLAVLVGRARAADGPLDIALVFKGLAREADGERSTSLLGEPQAPLTAAAGAAMTDEDDDDDDAPRRVLRTEGLQLRGGLTPADPPLVLLVPLHWPEAPQAVLVLALEARPAPAAGAPAAELAAHAEAVAQALDGVAAALAEQRRLSAALTEQEAFLQEILAAFGSLDVADRQRAALVNVAGAVEARLAVDLALVADEATLQAFVERVLAEREASAQVEERSAALGWLLERTAYRMFSTAASEGGLPPGLFGVLVRHAGEAARYAGTLDEIVAASRDIAELRERLLLENRLFLEDSSPAARLRAFDWLAARGAAPVGYDPLASREERRAALARAEAGAGTDTEADAGTDADSAAGVDAGTDAEAEADAEASP